MTDSVTVYLSGDAWNGDAEATLTINGAAVGGVLDVQASNAADNVEAFTFSGSFGTSPTVALSFINDASDGTAVDDRNLYLDGFSYDGVPQFNDKKELSYDQTVPYVLTSVTTSAMRAANFQNSLGADVHLDYLNTSYGIANGSAGNTALVASSLAYLGITHVRVGIPTATTLPEMQALMADGIKFDVLMPSTLTSATLAAQLSALAPIAGAVTSIEGPNEVNLTSNFSWNGQTGLTAASAYQQALYAAVKASASFANTPVYNLTLGGVGADGYAGLGNLTAYATDSNMHVYYINGTPPASTLQYAMGLAAVNTPTLPMVITETNYTSAPLITGSVSLDVQARYDLDLLMDATKDGVAATYLYELLDELPDPKQTNNEDHYGLFNSDGSPKEVATSIHNLMAILADSGATASSFTTGALGYTIAGLPASGNSLLLEKSTGAYDLVVWAEPEIWSVASGSQIAPTSRPVTVTFGSAQSEVKLFDPLTGTTVISDSKGVTSLTISVTDHPLILEIEPAAVPVPVVPPPVTIGTGSDTLALQLSEDAFQGDAQYTVAVDGLKVGGTMTVTASHAAGATQTLDILGNFGAGMHSLSIDFLNDKYTPGVGDRNLYLNSASLDGTAIANSALSLTSGGTQTMSFLSTATATIGAGSSTLALALSEDAYLGDAQFTVSIDGKAVGGTMTAVASHAAGQSQWLDILGSFTAGTHTLAIDFLNDKYTPGVGDRNLYLNSASLNGTAIAHSALALTSAGTQTLTFVMPASS